MNIFPDYTTCVSRPYLCIDPVCPTFTVAQWTLILDIQVWAESMDMCADFLSSLRGTKNPYDRDCRRIPLRQSFASVKLRIESCGSSLIVVETIQAEAENVAHYEPGGGLWY
jgi:hypothetical protein